MSNKDWLIPILEKKQEIDEPVLTAMAERLRKVMSAEDCAFAIEKLTGQAYPDIIRAMARVEVTETKSVTIAEAIDDFLADLDKERRYVPFGFPGLDDVLDGGLDSGDLMFLAGLPGSGKTALALQAAINAGARGKRVCIVSKEMRARALMRRIFSQRTGVYASTLKRKDLKDWQRERLMVAAENLRQIDVQFIEAAQTVDEILDEANSPEFMLVDYLQLLKEPSKKEGHEQISEIGRKLKIGAVDRDMAVVCISSLSREEKLRGSGALDFHADAIVMLSRPDNAVEYVVRTNGTNEWEEKHVKVIADFKKQRDGRIGQIELVFEEDCVRFLED